MHPRERLGASLFSIGGVSTVAFILVARAVARRETSYRDGVVRAQFPKRRRRRTAKTVDVMGRFGKKWVHGPFSLAVGALAWQRGAGAAAIAPPLASAAGLALSKLFERVMPHRSPPPGRHEPSNPSFPSGHSLETTAVILTSAYVLTREHITPARVAIPVALVAPLASGFARLYLERHWGSDVVGGWLAGIAVASACATVYEGLAD